MKDVCIHEVHTARDLAVVGEVLGAAGVGLEGGGVWAGVARYLVEDGEAARAALAEAGYGGAEVREAVVAQLEADGPGALGRLMTTVATTGVGLIAQYSDHENRKVLVVDDPARLRRGLT